MTVQDRAYPSVPKYLQDEWKGLFTKQLYCMGRDIRHEDNLLLRYGFTRQRPPNPDDGSSQYSFAEHGERVVLWGFGMLFAAGDRGLFLWRHEFEPKLVGAGALLPNIWDPDQLPRRTMPGTPEETRLMLRLLVRSTRWLEGYENWILATCGQAYRDESIRDRYSPGSRRLDERWRALSEEFEGILRPGREPDRDEPGAPSSKQHAQDGKRVCGPCGDMYPADGDFCPSCGWEGLPC